MLELVPRFNVILNLALSGKPRQRPTKKPGRCFPPGLSVFRVQVFALVIQRFKRATTVGTGALRGLHTTATIAGRHASVATHINLLFPVCQVPSSRTMFHDGRLRIRAEHSLACEAECDRQDEEGHQTVEGSETVQRYFRSVLGSGRGRSGDRHDRPDGEGSREADCAAS